MLIFQIQHTLIMLRRTALYWDIGHTVFFDRSGTICYIRRSRSIVNESIDGKQHPLHGKFQQNLLIFNYTLSSICSLVLISLAQRLDKLSSNGEQPCAEINVRGKRYPCRSGGLVISYHLQVHGLGEFV